MIVDSLSGEPVELDGESPTYETGADAAKAAKALTEQTGRKHRPAPIVENDSWRQREIARFDDGTYKKIPMSDWLANMLAVTYPDHFLHLACDKENMVAFTKDANMGAADRQTRMSASAYAKRYLTDEKGFCDSYRDVFAIYVEDGRPATVLFASEPDAIESVYTNYSQSVNQVSGSCMRYDSSTFHFGEHPTRVYGAGDLAVAYIANENGETTHRALCWPEKKLYSRVYGDDDKLHAALKDLGYSKSRYYGAEYAAMIGARILMIEAETDKGDVYVMPYFDEPVGVKMEGGQFVTCKSRNTGYSVTETNGTTDEHPDEDEDEDSEYCEYCEENVDETYLVYTRQSGTAGRGESSWCEHCRSNNAFYCEGVGEYFSDRIDSYSVNNETWSQGYFEENGFICPVTDEAFANDDGVEVITYKGESATWSKDAADDEDNAFQYDGAYYSNDVECIKDGDLKIPAFLYHENQLALELETA